MIRINKYLMPSDRDIRLINFKLECDEPLTPKDVYEKGMLIKTNYFGFYNELCVSESYVDVMEDGVFVGYDRLIEWYNDNDEVQQSRVLPKRMNKAKAFDFLIERRKTSISYLQASSVGTPIETFVSELMKRYKTEVELYISSNTNDFKNAINNETDVETLKLLNLVIDKDGNKVKDSIFKQII